MKTLLVNLRDADSSKQYYHTFHHENSRRLLLVVIGCAFIDNHIFWVFSLGICFDE